VVVLLTDFVRFSLAFLRLGTFIAVIPLFNMRNLPLMSKLGFAALCSLIIMPPLNPTWNVESLGVLITLSLGEVALGLIMAFLVILAFSVVNFAGHYVDTPMGFGMASIFDPALGTQVPVFSQFYHILTALIFFGIDAHLWILQAVGHSFNVIPFGGLVSMEPTFKLVMDLVTQVFIIGIQIALPVIATILLTDIGLGIVIRAVPQINVFVLGFPIKIVVGLTIVIFMIPTFVYITGRIFAIDGLLFKYFQGLLALGVS